MKQCLEFIGNVCFLALVIIAFIAYLFATPDQFSAEHDIGNTTITTK